MNVTGIPLQQYMVNITHDWDSGNEHLPTKLVKFQSFGDGSFIK